jgi:hypothetical protein
MTNMEMLRPGVTIPELTAGATGCPTNSRR